MALAWPASLPVSEMTWGIVNNSRAFTSTLSNAQQIVGQPGAYWQCTLTFGLLTRTQERQLSAFLGELEECSALSTSRLLLVGARTALEASLW